jgi:transglutaminase-like putative cysteine protease
MRLQAADPSQYLGEDDVIDLSHPAIQELAHRLRADSSTEIDFARTAFEHVRDTVTHSWDAQDSRVAVRASDALRLGTGLCYAKAHLLTAILRAGGVPAGLCYQILTDDGSTFMVHGLVAVHLDGDWHRQDPRGNKPGVNAEFSLAGERLAWPVDTARGERDVDVVFRAPSAAVVTALRQAPDLLELYRHGLPAEI